MNSPFSRLLLRATLPLAIAYLLMVGLAWLLAILYQLPHHYCWDLVRFSLPLLLVWIIAMGIHSWQRVRHLQRYTQEASRFFSAVVPHLSSDRHAGTISSYGTHHARNCSMKCPC